jgi:uncharacterized protein
VNAALGYCAAMKFSLDDPSDGYIVNAYEPGRVTINGMTHERSIVVLPDRIITEWDPQSVAELSAEHFRFIADLRPDVVLLGTGLKQLFLTPALYASIPEQGIGIEMMDTASACRTYNILATEGRRVTAILMLN